MKKSAVLNPFAAVLILSAALILFSGPAQASLYDGFTGAGINPSLWHDSGPNTGFFSQPGDGYLHFSETTGGIDDNLRSYARVSGPFFVSIDYSSFSATNSSDIKGGFDGSAALLWLGYSGNIWASLYFTKDNGTIEGFEANSHIGSIFTHLDTYIPSSVTSGSLGIGYNGILGPGGQVTLWYDAGSGWKELASASPDFTSDPYFAIEGRDLYGTSLSFQVHQVDLTHIPLPPSVLLLGTGLLGLGGWRKLRKS